MKKRKEKSRQELIQIRRETLLDWHKQAEAIFNQDKFSNKSVKRLQDIYNMCEEYSADFFEFVTHDTASLKKYIEKILKPQAAMFDFGKVLGRVEEKLKEQGKLEELKKFKKLIGKKKE